MVKRKGKAVSFDAMVKFFMQHYDIPTKKDIERLHTKIDNLETMLKSRAPVEKSRRSRTRKPAGTTAPAGSSTAASDVVLGIIKQNREGAGIPDIKKQTGFNDKKLRNIIFRLFKTGQIKREKRGIYSAV